MLKKSRQPLHQEVHLSGALHSLAQRFICDRSWIGCNEFYLCLNIEKGDLSCYSDLQDTLAISTISALA